LKVAIIGAGVSGMACAFRLNQLGIKPALFERRPIIGDVVNLYGLHLKCFNLFSNNPLVLFEKKYGLRIKPMCPVKKLVMYSSDKKITVRGRLGYIFNRGPGKTSLERQLFEQIDAHIFMDTYIMDSLIDELSKEFDAVVVATGCTNIPKRLGVLKETSIMQVRSGIIDGSFETGQVLSWMKTEYSNNSFTYLIPASENRAVITIIADNITPAELDYRWKQMIITENITNNILETWEHEYHGGRLKTNQIGNIYFVGNAGGLIDDFMGFGIINGIASGILAADAIVLGTDYQKSIAAIQKHLDHIHCFKLLAEKAEKDTWKRLTQVIGLPGISNIIYKTSFLKFHHIGSLIGKFVK